MADLDWSETKTLRSFFRPLTQDDPPGTPVLVRQDSGAFIETKTRSKPWQVAFSWVVLLEGCAGGFLMERCSVPPVTEGESDAE